MQMSCDRQEHQVLPDRWVKLLLPIKRQPASAQSASGTAEVSGRGASHHRPVSVIVASHQAECVAWPAVTLHIYHRTQRAGVIGPEEEEEATH